VHRREQGIAEERITRERSHRGVAGASFGLAANERIASGGKPCVGASKTGLKGSSYIKHAGIVPPEGRRAMSRRLPNRDARQAGFRTWNSQ